MAEHAFEVFGLDGRHDWHAVPRAVIEFRETVDLAVAAIWPQLAAAAWTFHDEHGRGFVILQMNDLPRLKESGGGQITFGYATPAAYARLRLLRPAQAILERAVSEYDPAHEALVEGVFTSPHGVVHCFRRAAHEPAPFVAAAMGLTAPATGAR